MTARVMMTTSIRERVITSADALQAALSEAITSHEKAETALLYIMEKYDFNTNTLHHILQQKRLNASFSHVTYKEIAPFVALDSVRFMQDIGTFELRRSRISTYLFKSIIEDMDIMLLQYGPPINHETEEAISCFLSPIFNRLIAEFGSAFQNLPESTFKGRIAPNGKTVHYFKAFGSISMLVIEVKLKVGNKNERLDAIAQVIAECDACDWENSTENFVTPVLGILWDGTFFHFFKFEGTTNSQPQFFRGAFPGDPLNYRMGLKLPDLIPGETTRPFIKALRLISETIFDLLLCSYISSITAFRDRFVKRTVDEAQRPVLDKWNDTLMFAQSALGRSRDAESKRQNKDIINANNTVLLAQTMLKSSIDTVPIIGDEHIAIMVDWDDEEIELA